MKQKGFALIYALLLTSILLIALSGVAISLISGIKLTRQSKNAIQVYALARNGMAEAFANYRIAKTKKVGLPKACNGTPHWYIYYYDKATSSYKLSDGTPTTGLTLEQWLNANPEVATNGLYLYRVCEGFAPIENDTIESIGIFQNNRLSLKAVIALPVKLPERHFYLYPVCKDPMGCPPGTPDPSAGSGTCKLYDAPAPNNVFPAADPLCNADPNYASKTSDTVEYSHMLDKIKIFQTNI